VSATAGAPDADFVSKLCADVVVDYRNSDDVAGLPLADVLIDTVGGTVLADAVSLVGSGGRLITLSEPPAAELSEGRSIEIIFFIVRADPEQLENIAGLLNEGELRSIVACVYPLEKGRSACEDGPSLHKPGMIVISVKA